MSKKVFVGGLPWASTDDDLNNMFSQFGTVVSATILKDRETGKSRGFGFVEMENDEQADAAIAALNGSDFGGRKLNVNEARPFEKRSGGGGGNFRNNRY